MMRSLRQMALDLARPWLDTAVPGETLRTWLADRLSCTTPAWEILLARRLLSAADQGCTEEAYHRLAFGTVTEGLRWRAHLAGDRVLVRGRLAAETGRWMNVLATCVDREVCKFLRYNQELLLRHVEVHRRKWLVPIAAHSAGPAWIEKHDVAIFLARQARTHHDPRLLNTALKLNDWAFAAHRRLPDGGQVRRYLLALAEQEFALAQLATGLRAANNKLPDTVARAA